jgi:cystathionine beta-synthase
MNDVVALMKKFDISQLPVVAKDGALVGIVSEIDLLNHLLTSDHKHEAEETIDAIIHKEVATVTLETPLEVLMTIFVTGQVAIVTDDRKPVGIITKIDLLDYLSTQTR